MSEASADGQAPGEHEGEENQREIPVHRDERAGAVSLSHAGRGSDAVRKHKRW